jgi:CheY-like chemotaxis protein
MKSVAAEARSVSSSPEPAPETPRPKRVMLVDDSPVDAESWRTALAERYGDRVSFESYQDPLKAIPHFGPDIDLLLLDLEMPILDGRKLAALAKERGVPCRRMVILSGHHADELHALFPKESCLAVINKTEREQQSAFLMILDSIIRKK